MEIEIIEKKSIYLLGIVGQGTAVSGSQWIQDLWDEANENFYELGNLAKTNEDGSFAGFWGAMSDVDDSFLPWGWQGKYLASCEVNQDTLPPSKRWTKWTIPAFKYLSVKVNHENTTDIIDYMNNQYFPKNKYQLVGAIQEFYDPKLTNGEFYLYFPIEVLF